MAQRDTEGLASGHSFQVLAFQCSATTRPGCVSSAVRSRVLPDDGRVVISAMLVASRESSAMLFEVSPLAFRIKVSIKGVVWVQRIVHLRVNLLWVASEINQFLFEDKNLSTLFARYSRRPFARVVGNKYCVSHCRGLGG